MRSEAEKRTIKTPKIHIYTGDGKGKTTAALGRAFTHEVREGFAMAQELMQTRACDMLILDEIFGCLQNGQITEAELLTLMQNKTAELVLTGRNAPQSAVCAADYVSEIRAVKHPMETGLDAREGIEF